MNDIKKLIDKYFDLKDWKLSLVGKNNIKDIRLNY